MNHKEAIESGTVAIHDPEGKNAVAIATFLKGLGLSVHETVLSSFYFDYPYIVQTTNQIGRGRSQAPQVENSKEKLTFVEFLSRTSFEYKPASVEIKLNSKYSAIVSKDKIKVGCQEFDISILDKLVGAHKSLI